MNRPARFTVADLRRALKAAEAAGHGYAVEIDPNGTIRIVRRADGKPAKSLVEAYGDIVL